MLTSLRLKNAAWWRQDKLLPQETQGLAHMLGAGIGEAARPRHLIRRRDSTCTSPQLVDSAKCNSLQIKTLKLA
jgi:hypothetical protein